MFNEILDTSKICRLCLNSSGPMSSIHAINTTNQTNFSLCDKILSFASVQILPDDGLPSLICHTCIEKTEQFISFKEQIEHSYNILRQCVEATTDKRINEMQNFDAAKIIVPSTGVDMKEITVNKSSGNVKKSSDNIHITSLIKDHLVSGISENDILVSQDFNLVNIGNYNYINIGNTAADNFSTISMPDDSMSIESNSNLLQKDLSMIAPVDNEDPVLSYSKLTPLSSESAKVFNIYLAESSHDNLQDIFPSLNEDESVSCQDGFEDISKYLKNSHGLDIKKLKEDFKNKESCLDLDQEILKRKLLNSGISLIKASSVDNKCKKTCNITGLSEGVDIPSSVKIENDNIKSAIVEKSYSQKDDSKDYIGNDFPDMVFAQMSAVERDKYTASDNQEEIVPRMVRITHLDTDVAGSQFKFTTYLCHLCLTEFRECSLNVLKNHSNSHFNENKVRASCQNKPVYTCEGCVERFTSRYTFINHQRKEFNLKVFSCENCNKRFWSKEKLQTHLRVHSGNVTSFPCVFCGEKFNKKCELQSHEMSHTRNSPLICQHCNKEYNNIIGLKNHLKRHNEGMKYCCEVCGKRFYLMSQLKRHEQSHSGVRKFPCHICPKAFCSNSERRRHLFYHFKTKRFQCPQCEKRFYEAGHLKLHLQVHTNHRPFICDVCAGSFHTRYKLKRHLANHHKTGGTSKKSSDSTKTVVQPKFVKLHTFAQSDSVINLSDRNPWSDGESYIILQEDMEEEDSADTLEDIAKCLKNSSGLNFKKYNSNDKYSHFVIEQENIDENLWELSENVITAEETCSKLGGNNDRDTVQIPEANIKDSEDTDDEDSNIPDMIFAKMNALERDKYTLLDPEKEIVPRIVPLTHLDSNVPETQFKFTTFLCHLCLTEFRECTLDILEKHSSSHFSTRNIKAVCQDSPSYYCEDCSQTFSSRQLFIGHQRNKLDIKVFDCHSCNESFSSRERLAAHVCLQIRNSSGFFCVTCGMTFDEETKLESHEIYCSQNGPADSTNISRNEEKNHSDSSKYCCKICGKRFSMMSHLKKHEHSHYEVTKFDKYNAGTSASSSEKGGILNEAVGSDNSVRLRLTNCNKELSDGKRFKCNLCNGSFQSRYHLKRHNLKLHNTNKSLPSNYDELQSIKQEQYDGNSDYNSMQEFISNLPLDSSWIDGESYIIVQEDSTEGVDNPKHVDRDSVNANGIETPQDLDDRQIYFILEDTEFTGE